MSDVTVALALSDADVNAVRVLCQDWIDWQLKTFPEERERILKVFDPVIYAQTIADLPTIHARPKGAILLGTVKKAPGGCVMYQELEPGVAEVKRLFVRENARGHRLGEALLTGMFDQMRADGYKTVRFSSAKFLIHARSLYERVGFTDIPHPEGWPDFLRPITYHMERPL